MRKMDLTRIWRRIQTKSNYTTSKSLTDKVLVYFPDSGTEKVVHKYKDLIHDVNDPNYTEEELKRGPESEARRAE